MSGASFDAYDEVLLLPTIEGPKLGRFQDGKYGKIEYVELLGGSDDDGESPGGDHGYVFKVRIDGTIYALKIFRFYDPEEALGMLSPALRSLLSLEDVEGQTDPFYAECRAYGRIQAKPRRSPIAIACHGYVIIPAEQESFFTKRFGITEWNRPETEVSLPAKERQPLRGLVKEIVDREPEVTSKLIEAMRRELKALNKLKIYVMDVRWSNYKGGHLVDFSASWTEPHYEFRRDINSSNVIRMLKQVDVNAFRMMVKDELGMSTVLDSRPGVMERLRPREKIIDYRH